jgi:hypothetical protein
VTDAGRGDEDAMEHVLHSGLDLCPALTPLFTAFSSLFDWDLNSTDLVVVRLCSLAASCKSTPLHDVMSESISVAMGALDLYARGACGGVDPEVLCPLG